MLPGNWAIVINFGFWCDTESRFTQFSHIDYWAVYFGLCMDLSHWGLFSCPNTKIFWKGHSALWKWNSPGKAGCPVLYLGTKGPRGQTWALPSSGRLKEFPSDGKMLRPVPGEKEEHHWSLLSGKSLRFGILSSLLCTREVTTGSSPLSSLANQGKQWRHNYFVAPSCLIKRNPSAQEGLVGRIRGHRRGQRVNSSTWRMYKVSSHIF